MARRADRHALGLHDALAGIAGRLYDFLDAKIDSDQLWRPFSDWFRQDEGMWNASVARRLEEFFFVVESCVPTGFVPDPEQHEIDEAELRRQMRELLVEAGYEPPDPPH